MSATIVVIGKAEVTDARTSQPLAEPERLAEVGKLHYAGDLMSRYLDDGLDELELSGGDIRLQREPDGSGVRIVSTFEAPRKVSAARLKQLAKNVAGQWSDGIGENCFCEDAKALEVNINLVQHRTPRVEQTVGAEPENKKPAVRPSVLVKAAEAGDLEKVKQLLEAGTNPNGKDSREITALLAAAMEGHLAVVEALLAAGADVNGMSWSGTALNAAARGAADKPDRNLAVARALLAAGADPNLAEEDWEGCRTTLSWAVSDGGPEFVKLLLDAGADPNQRDAMSNEVGGTDDMTPLMRAKSPDVAMLLLEAGTDPTLRNSDRKASTAAATIRKNAKAHGLKSCLGQQCIATAEVIEKWHS